MKQTSHSRKRGRRVPIGVILHVSQYPIVKQACQDANLVFIDWVSDVIDQFLSLPRIAQIAALERFGKAVEPSGNMPIHIKPEIGDRLEDLTVRLGTKKARLVRSAIMVYLQGNHVIGPDKVRKKAFELVATAVTDKPALASVFTDARAATMAPAWLEPFRELGSILDVHPWTIMTIMFGSAEVAAVAKGRAGVVAAVRDQNGGIAHGEG